VTLLFASLLGLVIGSFLNVCIVRLPHDESVIEPRSHCRSCKNPLAWYDNIPLISYLILRGRCRTCSESFSVRYPAVEALTAVLFALIVSCDLPPRETVLDLVLAAALVVVTFIDIDYFIIPDEITWPSILIAPAVAFVVQHVSVRDSVTGILLGGGILWAFAWSYEKLRGREGMGLGDVKLLAMIGGLQGWQAPLFSLMAGAIVGSTVGLALMAARGRRFDMEIPFGPFLAFGSILYMLEGPRIIDLYFSHPPLF